MPRKGSSLTVSVRIVAKFVTDLHTDSGLIVFHTYAPIKVLPHLPPCGECGEIGGDLTYIDTVFPY